MIADRGGCNICSYNRLRSLFTLEKINKKTENKLGTQINADDKDQHR